MQPPLEPLTEIRRRASERNLPGPSKQASAQTPSPTSAGAASQKPDKSKFDWFDFFLQCGVNPQICERYSSAFDRDQMGEENLQDIMFWKDLYDKDAPEN